MRDSVIVTYQYKNMDVGTTKLWLSWSSSQSSHHATKILKTSQEPKMKTTDQASNEIAYFEFDEQESLIIHVIITKECNSRLSEFLL